MNLIAREAAGREWVYQLREWAAELDAQGRPVRAHELARLATETEREIALLHTATHGVPSEVAPTPAGCAREGWGVVSCSGPAAAQLLSRTPIDGPKPPA